MIFYAMECISKLENVICFCFFEKRQKQQTDAFANIHKFVNKFLKQTDN